MASRLIIPVSLLLMLGACSPAAAPASPSRLAETAAPSITSAPSTTSPPASHDGPPSAPPSATPALTPPPPASSPLPAAALPVTGQEEFGAWGVRLAPAGDGSIYVLVPGERGAVLTRLGRDGRPASGWPVRVPGATACEFLGVAADGTARMVCNATDIAQPEWCCETVRAFAVDRDGGLLAGWPREIDIPSAVRVVGNDLVFLADLPVTDMEGVGIVTKKARLSRIESDGTMLAGTQAPVVYRGGGEAWAIGPDGLAYATSLLPPAGDPGPEGWTRSEIRAVGEAGFVPGWSVSIDGIASAAGFDGDGRLVFEVGMMDEVRTRLVGVDASGRDANESVTLPYQSASSGLSCDDWPQPPLTADGSIVVEGGGTFYGFDEDLQALDGWPYEAPERQALGWPDPRDLDCGPAGVDPALASDGTLYVPVAAASDAEGGRLVAVARDGSLVPGWPVGLRRADAGFWMVATDEDGVVFALAAERERDGPSATLLAISPDITVRWRTTLIDP